MQQLVVTDEAIPPQLCGLVTGAVVCEAGNGLARPERKRRGRDDSRHLQKRTLGLVGSLVEKPRIPRRENRDAIPISNLERAREKALGAFSLSA